MLHPTERLDDDDSDDDDVCDVYTLIYCVCVCAELARAFAFRADRRRVIVNNF